MYTDPHLQKLLDDTYKLIDHYEQNPSHPNASTYVECYCNRAEAIQKMIFKTEQQNFFS